MSTLLNGVGSVRSCADPNHGVRQLGTFALTLRN